MFKLQGDTCEDLLLILEGVFAATFEKEDGKTILVERLKAPEAAASAILFSTEKTLPVTLTAETEVTVLLIAAPVLLSLFQLNRTLLKNYLEDIGNRVVFLADKIRYLQMKSLRQKICTYILDLSRKQKSEKIFFDYSLEKLSELFSVARPSLSRELAHLIDEGFIRRESRALVIHNKQSLLRILQAD